MFSDVDLKLIRAFEQLDSNCQYDCFVSKSALEMIETTSHYTKFADLEMSVGGYFPGVLGITSYKLPIQYLFDAQLPYGTVEFRKRDSDEAILIEF